MNRGSVVRVVRRQVKRLASMRPRFMNRGSIHTSAALRGQYRRFNEAPIHESGKCQYALVCSLAHKRLQ